MAQSFCCFCEIDGQKYDIIINENISSVGFEDIYQKIQQIIKIILKQDISFETNIFEVSLQLLIMSFDEIFTDFFQTIDRYSTIIRVKV